MDLNIFCSIIRIRYSIGVSIAAGVTALITIPILYDIMLLPQTVLRAVNPLTLLPVQICNHVRTRWSRNPLMFVFYPNTCIKQPFLFSPFALMLCKDHRLAKISTEEKLNNAHAQNQCEPFWIDTESVLYKFSSLHFKEKNKKIVILYTCICKPHL